MESRGARRLLGTLGAFMEYRSLTTAALLAASLGWASTVLAENTWVRVKGGGWEPDPQVLLELKAQLEPYTKDKAQKGGRKLKNWSEYTFQYQGKEEKGRKYVFVNALCHKHPEWNLEQQMILVDDGGTCFFNLKFDPARRQYYDLIINGEA